MIKGNDIADREDPFALNRFISAQEGIYAGVLAELRSGRKRTHWMWFMFPQIDGLGHSATTIFYAIKSTEEARRYLNHPILGARLVECTEAVLAVKGRSISEIFGYPDDMKFKSSMTLFSRVAGPDSVFARALDRYFQGEGDVRTLRLMENLR
jgi:uncharacterized protein (DUF1810 family)